MMCERAGTSFSGKFNFIAFSFERGGHIKLYSDFLSLARTRRQASECVGGVVGGLPFGKQFSVLFCTPPHTKNVFTNLSVCRRTESVGTEAELFGGKRNFPSRAVSKLSEWDGGRNGWNEYANYPWKKNPTMLSHSKWDKHLRENFYNINEVMEWGEDALGVLDFKSSEFVRRLNDCKLHPHVSATRVPRDGGISCICWNFYFQFIPLKGSLVARMKTREKHFAQ